MAVFNMIHFMDWFLNERERHRHVTKGSKNIVKIRSNIYTINIYCMFSRNCLFSLWCWTSFRM